MMLEELKNKAVFFWGLIGWLIIAFSESAHIRQEKMKRVIDMVAVGMLCIIALAVSLVFLRGELLAISLGFFGIAYLVDGLIYRHYIMNPLPKVEA